ncbi:receptor-type tyrosine-protein phosphatase-like N isoform X2 [Trachemys scripta elegans]|uniref:receptor-type tyrosine-protein phosphatase-like N isoform X2 n=1 Tax=Trachemys scripta elegans TaxID=31138 RepID=UPI001551B102|nr:receptor-type tyrosine-protein phosphatase-like N isoform X2 [Trachemys scripta elegans]
MDPQGQCCTPSFGTVSWRNPFHAPDPLGVSFFLQGCLFDRRLCSQQEVCVQDGLFGQCQESAARDRPYFQVTSPVLQRLQDVLRRLTAQGLSWQDDITQYVISQEMEQIPRLRPPPAREPVAKERFSLLHAAPRMALFPSELSQLGSALQMAPRPLPASAKKSPRLEPLPPALLQRYLELLLLGPPPELGYEEGLLHPYSYHKFGYQDGARQLSPIRGNSARQSPEPPALLGRAPAQASQALFGASPIPSYGGQPGLDGGHLFQDLGMLYLPREKASRLAPASMKAQHGQGLPPDYAEPDEENRQQQPALGPQVQSDAALQRLVAVLADYGVGLQDLSPQQLGSLSALLQLLQRPGGFGQEAPEAKRVTEGEMQHGEEPEPPPSTVPPPENPASAASRTEGPRWEEVAGPARGSARPTSASQAELQAPGQAAPRDPAAGDVLHLPVEKKSYTEPRGHGGKGEQPEPRPAEEYGYIVTDQKPLGLAVGVRLLEILAERVHLSTATFINISVVGPALTFRIRQNHQNLSLADVTDQAAMVKSELEAELGLKIVQMGVGQRNEATPYPHPSHFGDTFHSVLLTFLALACVAGVVIAAAIVFCLRQHAKQREKDRLAALGPEGTGDSTFEYQELCRQHMAAKSLFGRADAPPAPAENSRVSSVSSQFSDAPQASPSSHSSTPSWCEEPVQSNMDISTGHMILAYMEDHLRNRDRLAKEWQALCAYQAEPSVCTAAQSEANLKKNRNPDYVPYDHARIKLKAESNPSRSDFINASPIIEHDPRMPAYIATQGPLSHTIADFWQMVWENGCTVIVMLSPLVEDSVKQCDRYWPDEGSSLYHIYEVNLVSEHIWCEDFLVRSFYLKNVQSQETRTLTQFHFLSWPAEGIPTTTRPLLDFRRKVNKCYRGRSCPVIVHCSDGAGRTGTYILIDMVLNRMAKGVKEIDIAATLEHVRDQRPGMVQTKDQFEFALTAVAEEVNAILKALPQ